MNKKLAAIGLGAVLIYLILRPKKAKAETVPASALPVKAADAIPPPVKTNAPTAETHVDEATGAVLAGPSEPIPAGQNHTVAKGESWSNIASRTYGDYRWWLFLWDTNRLASPGRYLNPDILAIGTVIQLPPSVPTSADYKKAIMARAAAHAAWYKAGAKQPLPASVTNITPIK